VIFSPNSSSSSKTNNDSLIVNNQLNIMMEDGKINSDVWALGDAAVIEDTRLPATAQGAIL
jgi:hypothetical protein